MAKREVIGLKDGGWWVWLCGAPAMIVGTEAEARDLIIRSWINSPGADHSLTIACPDIRVVWNDPLPEGEDSHKGIFMDVNLVSHRGVPRKTVPHFTAKQLKKREAGWQACYETMRFGHELSWPAQYQAALADSEVLVLRRLGRQKMNTLNQLDLRWPSGKV